MIIIGNILEVVEEKKFSITWYHRAPLGLERGTHVWIVLLPPLSVKPALHDMAEVILTPINPMRWADLWRIECKFHEKPGVIAALLDTLRGCGINILHQESATIQRDRVVADLTNYTDQDGDYPARMAQRNLKTLQWLYKRIGVECVEDLIFQTDQSPAISISRMWDYYHGYFAVMSASPTSAALQPVAVPVKARGQIEIQHPVLVQEIKKQILGERYEPDSEANRLKQVILFTNTEERYISALFPDPSHNIAMFELEHDERIGALSGLAGIFKDMGINVLCSFNRLVDMGRVAQWNVVADLGGRTALDVKEEYIKRAKAAKLSVLKKVVEKETFGFGRKFVV